MKNKHMLSWSRKRDPKALESRRRQAIRLHERGKSQYFIAKQLQVSFEAVSNWIEAYKKGGLEGLKSKGKPGPKSQLDDEDRKQLKTAILKGPKALGYSTDLWTLERIGKVIKNISKADYHPGHVWKILISLGFSCQKPETRARERDEQGIKEWKLQTFPALKKMG